MRPNEKKGPKGGRKGIGEHAKVRMTMTMLIMMIMMIMVVRIMMKMMMMMMMLMIMMAMMMMTIRRIAGPQKLQLSSMQ